MAKLNCLVCGDEFEAKPVHIRTGYVKTCSRKCGGIRKSKMQAGKGHWNWKGGRTLHKGYVFVHLMKDSPFRESYRKDRGNRILEHRLVMAQALGRPLKRDEQVHHRDNNKQNNSLENLELRTGSHGNGGTNHCLTCTCEAT